jgi:RNA-directed DNA polymerase
MTTAQAVGAVSDEAAEWYAIDWQTINRNVRRLQVRIVQATKEGRWGRVLRYLWHEQRGLCTQCSTKITRITGWRLHYRVPRVQGGSTGATNCVLLHPECHDRVHPQRLSVSKPRLL